jgi:hypothetical protein
MLEVNILWWNWGEGKGLFIVYYIFIHIFIFYWEGVLHFNGWMFFPSFPSLFECFASFIVLRFFIFISPIFYLTFPPFLSNIFVPHRPLRAFLSYTLFAFLLWGTLTMQHVVMVMLYSSSSMEGNVEVVLGWLLKKGLQGSFLTKYQELTLV